jgi:non-ribosomal peptide synthetase component F
MAEDLSTIYMGDESHLPKLHGTFSSSQLSTDLEICFDKELSVPGLESGYTTNVKLVTAWAILLASYANESDLSIIATKELKNGISRNVVAEWWMRVADLTRHIEGQLGDILPDPSTESEHVQHIFVAIAQQESVVSRTTRNNHTLILRCYTSNDKIYIGSSLSVSPEESAFSTQIQQQWQHILQEICRSDGMEKSLADLKVITMRGLHQVWSWNAQVPQGNDFDCIHHAFMRSARRHPELPAICANDGDWTYRELDELSTRLAHALIRQHLQQNQIVLIYMEKSKWVPVAQLAVMKAGCASTVLDASLPLERQKVIANLVRACYVLTSPNYISSAAELCSELGPVVVDVESAQQWPPAQSTFLPVVSPTQRLYLVFTSGSTGTPKGVIITHQNYASAIATQSRQLGFQKFDRVFDFTSYAFDVSQSKRAHN